MASKQSTAQCYNTALNSQLLPAVVVTVLRSVILADLLDSFRKLSFYLFIVRVLMLIAITGRCCWQTKWLILLPFSHHTVTV